MKRFAYSWAFAAVALVVLFIGLTPRAVAQDSGIAGTVLDVAAKPWADIPVHIVSDQGVKLDTKTDAKGATLYLLGLAHTQAKNYPKAITALERAAQKTPDDVNIYRMLGYDYEVLKQYAKALAAYEKGLQLAPKDAELKESAERVRPFAKQ